MPPHLLKKYIAYARAYCRPILTPEAAALLKAFFLDLRARAAHRGVPTTTRQLEALVRLAEARAKVDLRERVTREDAADVIELFRSSLAALETDDDGILLLGGGGGFGDVLGLARDGQGPVKRLKKGGKNAEAKRFLEAIVRRGLAAGADEFSKGAQRNSLKLDFFGLFFVRDFFDDLFDDIIVVCHLLFTI